MSDIPNTTRSQTYFFGPDSPGPSHLPGKCRRRPRRRSFRGLFVWFPPTRCSLGLQVLASEALKCNGPDPHGDKIEIVFASNQNGGYTPYRSSRGRLPRGFLSSTSRLVRVMQVPCRASGSVLCYGRRGQVVRLHV